MASLLASEYPAAANSIQYAMEMPDAVSILLDGRYTPMHTSGRQTWHYKDVVVKLQKQQDSIAVFIQAPETALQEIQLSWQFASRAEVKILGDAWERTYGDVGFSAMNPALRLPWYCVEQGSEATACFGVKTGCNAFCYWRIAENKLELNLDTRNGADGVLLGGRTLHAADIVTTKNKEDENTFATVHRFCRQMCDKPRTVKQPVYGINDWYFAYGNNSAKLILEHTALLSPLATSTTNRPFSVIDDGWSEGSDYACTNKKFPDMPKLIEDIKQLGMRAGLWTRPLLAKQGTPKNLFIEKHDNILDPTIDENITYVKSLFRLYKSWGIEMVKHDYTTFEIFGRYGVNMKEALTFPGWHFNNRSKTNAEIILSFYKAIRDAAGDMYLIGCNTISHLSAGLFELYRIGDDTSGKEWAGTKKMGVNTLGVRMVQHRSFYQADGDCVGLTTRVPWQKNKQWMQLLAQSSTPLFISAQPEAIGLEQKQFIKRCFDDAATHLPLAEPLDWTSNFFPQKWRLKGEVVQFQWD